MKNCFYWHMMQHMLKNWHKLNSKNMNIKKQLYESYVKLIWMPRERLLRKERKLYKNWRKERRIMCKHKLNTTHPVYQYKNPLILMLIPIFKNKNWLIMKKHFINLKKQQDLEMLMISYKNLLVKMKLVNH